MESIISALIGAGVAIITCFINNHTQRLKEQRGIEIQIAEIKASNERTTAVIEERIQTLTEHVNKHNDLINRMYRVEQLTEHLDYMIQELKEDDRK